MRPKLTLQTHANLLPTFLLFAAALLLGACSLLPGQEPEAEPTPEQTRTAAVFPTVTASPEPTATPTSTPEPTPVPVGVTVSDQEVGEDGVLIVDEVSLPEPGWLAVFSVSGGAAGELLGYVDLPDGVHRNTRITVDPFQATDTLIARLHRNAGDLQAFELPEPDVPMTGDVAAEFAVDISLPQSTVTVDDQEIGEDGVVTVSGVRALEPLWVVIHADENGSAGAAIGQALLDAGEYENLTVPIRWREGTPQLHVVLHEDSGTIGYFDFPQADLPLVANGAPVATTFSAAYPPEVLVYDQPVLDGAVVIERVISNGPGWVVVHQDEDGQPGLIIGEAPLDDGLNEQIGVNLIEAALTPLLYARVHHDTNPGDEFSFPEADLPVLNGDRLPRAQAFRTDAGSYVIIDDQPVTADNEIVAAMVVATGASWLVIHSDEDGEPGAILGETLVEPGISRDVVVMLESVPESGLVHAVLYQDVGESGVFEFPGGPDTPYRVLGGVVRVPFQILIDGDNS